MAKKIKTIRKTVKNNVVEEKINTGNYKIQYRVVIHAIINKELVPIQSNKLSEAVKFTIVKK